GHGAQQLGIVAAAGALVCVGPTVIEDVFALAVALEPEGHDAEDAALRVPQGEVPPGPALGRDGAAGGLAGVEEVEGDEGVAGGRGAGVPGLAAYVGDPVVDVEGEAHARLPRSGFITAVTTRSRRTRWGLCRAPLPLCPL